METDGTAVAPGQSVDAADRGPPEGDRQHGAEAPLGEGTGGAGDPEVVVEVTWTGPAGDTSPSGEEEWNGFLAGTAEGPGEEEQEERVPPEWKRGDPVTPQHVLRLRGYTREFLCSPEDNVYNINFSRFKIRELQSGAVILDIKKHCPTEIKDVFDVDPGRFIQYHFSPSFLALKEIGATLEFTVGRRAVNRLRLIERHFFRNLLLKTFDFEIGFCIPFSRNTCEHIYSLPDLDPIAEMVASPFETRSDSFYFANNRLIMHHKAEYSFDQPDPSSSSSSSSS
uniref:GMP phosphodiesterase delta subunit domain-containing protein n=1 Tax=Gadus morhua TaxID=8049 RepID=A0A8C5B5B6_GADMO